MRTSASFLRENHYCLLKEKINKLVLSSFMFEDVKNIYCLIGALLSALAVQGIDPDKLYTSFTLIYSTTWN